jgi:NtrC-family two-component system response regulator AlgB
VFRDFLVQRALQAEPTKLAPDPLPGEFDKVPALEATSRSMAALIEMAKHAASSDATVLLRGESGTGKNLLARQIHDWSERRGRSFIRVNCTSLSERQLESELFGFVRGAFAGAMRGKPGRIEAATKGTLFLDEVAEIPTTVQVKLLRFLEDRTFEPLGGEESIKADTRIIAATNRNLDAEVSSKRFREDLYYRLNVVSLQVPSLRERSADIIPLAEAFLASAAVRNNRPCRRLSAEAIEALKSYCWPGNVRELRNAIERAAVLGHGDTIAKDDLPDSILRLISPASEGSSAPTNLDEVETELIRRVVAESATMREAARKLGINLNTLWRKRKRYGLL